MLRSARTHVLHGAACAELRAVARRVDADAVVIVGEAPATALRGWLLPPVGVTAYRPEGESPTPSVDILPSLPRLAADRMVAVAEHNGASALA